MNIDMTWFKNQHLFMKIILITFSGGILFFIGYWIGYGAGTFFFDLVLN